MKWDEMAAICAVLLYNLLMFAGAGLLVWHGASAWVFIVPLLVCFTRIKTGKSVPYGTKE